MFSARLDILIPDLRRHLCPRSLPDKDGWADGIVFNAHLWLSSGASEERAYFRILFTGNTSVFVDPGRQGFEPLSKKDWLWWANTCNHDVCWSTSGLRVLTDEYFDMANRVDPLLPPAMLADHSSLGHLGAVPPWEFVRCKVVRDETDKNNYRRKIVGLEVKNGY